MWGEIQIVINIDEEEKERIREAQKTIDEVGMALDSVTSGCDSLNALKDCSVVLQKILEGKTVY